MVGDGQLDPSAGSGTGIASAVARGSLQGKDIRPETAGDLLGQGIETGREQPAIERA